MTFTETELDYLLAHPLGRLASIGPDGAPQNHPVAIFVDPERGTIDIGGPALGRSQKFRNVCGDPRVSLVVDDHAGPGELTGPGGQTGRGLEIRGRAETFVADRPLTRGFGNEVIRVHPQRLVTWNLGVGGQWARNVEPTAGPVRS